MTEYGNKNEKRNSEKVLIQVKFFIKFTTK